MIRINIREQVLNVMLLLLVQLPLLHKLTLFDQAFGFFYVGFLLFLPRSLSRSYGMLLGFIAGLSVDVFSDTPGIHASASVLLMFVRPLWLNVVNDDYQETINLNVFSLKKTGFLLYTLPLILIHHFVIFVIENGGFHLFGFVFTKIIFSTVFSFIIIFVISYVVAPKGRRE